MTRRPASLLEMVPGGFSELWARGNLLFVVPVISERYPRELREATVCRRSVLLTGLCPCGAQFPLDALDPTKASLAVILHAADCPAEHAENLMADWIASGETRRP